MRVQKQRHGRSVRRTPSPFPPRPPPTPPARPYRDNEDRSRYLVDLYREADASRGFGRRREKSANTRGLTTAIDAGE